MQYYDEYFETQIIILLKIWRQFAESIMEFAV